MSFRRELFSFVFGVVLILLTFGDDHLGKIAGVTIGNLDTIFGYKLWPILDLIYPLTAVVIFLLYGWTNGTTPRTRWSSTFLFLSFLLVLGLFSIDDIGIGLHNLGFQLGVALPRVYWLALSWAFPVYSGLSFFLFGNIRK